MFSKINKILFLGIALVFLFLPSFADAAGDRCCLTILKEDNLYHKCEYIGLGGGCVVGDVEGGVSFDLGDESFEDVGAKQENVKCESYPICKDAVPDTIFCGLRDPMKMGMVNCYKKEGTRCGGSLNSVCVKGGEWPADEIGGYYRPSEDVDIGSETDCTRDGDLHLYEEQELSADNPLCIHLSQNLRPTAFMWTTANSAASIEELTMEMGLIKEKKIKTLPSSQYVGWTITKVECLNCFPGKEIEFVELQSDGDYIVKLKVNSLKFDAKKLPINDNFLLLATMEKPGEEPIQGNNSAEKVLYQLKITKVDCSKNTTVSACSAKKLFCFWNDDVIDNKCMSRVDAFNCGNLSKKYCGTDAGVMFCTWGDGRCRNAVEMQAIDEHPAPEGWEEGLLPKCAYKGTCNDTNDLLELVVRAGKFILGLVGMFAFVFFVYGGFTWIISFGNANMVKKGRDTMLAAMVGMVIALAAYTAVDFVLDLLQVSQDFRF